MIKHATKNKELERHHDLKKTHVHSVYHKETHTTTHDHTRTMPSVTIYQMNGRKDTIRLRKGSISQHKHQSRHQNKHKRRHQRTNTHNKHRCRADAGAEESERARTNNEETRRGESKQPGCALSCRALAPSTSSSSYLQGATCVTTRMPHCGGCKPDLT